MKKTKRYLAILLSALLCAGLALPAFAAEPSILKPAKNYAAANGKTITLEVVAALPEGAANATYQWYEQERAVDGSATERLIEGAADAKLTLVARSDELLQKATFGVTRTYVAQVNYTDAQGAAASARAEVPLRVCASLPECYQVLRVRYAAAWAESVRGNWMFLFVGGPAVFLLMPIFYGLNIGGSLLALQIVQMAEGMAG
ncbi:MAG: hypothetical protein LBG83_06160 [Oscillospiraceae bacterium]|jgi:hypothetical protein|nr:hypothetical protein [Oscillospiraceae bacterium]